MLRSEHIDSFSLAMRESLGSLLNVKSSTFVGDLGPLDSNLMSTFDWMWSVNIWKRVRMRTLESFLEINRREVPTSEISSHSSVPIRGASTASPEQ